MLSTIDAQLDAVADRLANVLSPALVDAYQQGAEGARRYLDAVTPTDFTPMPIEISGVTTEGVRVTVGGTAPGLATPGAFTITEQQLAAVAQGRGFGGFPGLAYDLEAAVARWTSTQAKAVRQRLEAGFLLSLSNSEIVADLRGYLEGATRAQVEAVVRTSMMTASQAAHDAFYAANEDALGDAQGNRYRWDASNDGRTCSICAPLDDSRYPTREAVPKHPAHFNCRCVVLPITPISDQLDPGQGSFLESVPVEYETVNGRKRRKPAPPGYRRNTKPPTGDFKYAAQIAYAQPRKINGEWRWVRRRDDLPAGRSTAGEMLVRANDQTRRDVLGSQANVDAFNVLTAPGGRFHRDPQGAVIELLRPGGLPPGATRRLRPTPARR